jgi:hypothetical protein
MKTTILNKEINEDIDWSKSQWLISKMGHIVFTNGKHDNYTFEGTCLPSDNSYPCGLSSNGWYKSYFQPILAEGLTIHIKND